MQRTMKLFAPSVSNFTKENAGNKKLETILRDGKVIPVISVSDLSLAVPLVKALSTGGLKVIEVALRTPVAIEAIKQIKIHCPEVMVGAATVMTEDEMIRAVRAGAAFCASPLFDKNLMHFAARHEIPYLPCVSNLEQINTAAKAGFKVQKLFPMESLDKEQGEKFLRGTLIMVNKLQVKFCTSCLETAPEDIERYLKHPSVIATASGWSAPSDLVVTQKWHEITLRAQKDKLRADDIKKTMSSPETSPSSVIPISSIRARL